MKRVRKVEERIVLEKNDYLNSVVEEVFEKPGAIVLKLSTEHGIFYAYSYTSGLHELVEESSDVNWATSKYMTYDAGNIINSYIEQYKRTA